MPTTLRVQLQVRDYDLWRTAFDRDAGGRERNGARRYRIFRPIDDEHEVMLDLDFDDTTAANGFLDVLRRDVWPSPEKAPAKVGAAHTRIIELVDSHEY